MAKKKVIELDAAALSPLQGAMLQLCGYQVMRHGVRKAKADDQFMKTVREGRSMLISLTDVDLGYRLSRWNKHLLTHHYDEYHANDAWRYVKALLQLAGQDEARRLLVKRMKRLDEAARGGRSVRTQSMLHLETESARTLEEQQRGSEVEIRYLGQDRPSDESTDTSEPFDEFDLDETPAFGIQFDEDLDDDDTPPHAHPTTGP